MTNIYIKRKNLKGVLYKNKLHTIPFVKTHILAHITCGALTVYCKYHSLDTSNIHILKRTARIYNKIYSN